MPLSSELVSQFAKLASNKPKEEKESTVYGTTVIQNGNKYVKLDGSELLTPASFTTNIADGERVTVLIKNHMAIVTGNITSPAARTSEVEEVGDKVDAAEAAVKDLTADNLKVNQRLEAQEGSIKNLTSDNVTIKNKLNAQEASIGNLEAENVTITGKLEAAEGNISNLQADNVTINESLTAAKASIKELDTKKLSADQADIKYANIDFTNIGKAAMEYLYSKSGLIENVTVGDEQITGTLAGVTIKGDLIEGNTVVADKLVIKGSDGLYYKLNTDGVKIEKEQTDYNSLNGSIITAKSITATKISVSDLVAFDATIGGFNITSESLYSGVKESADNTTRGIYLGKDGQLSVGDSQNYLKYYKTSDGSYKLEIAVGGDDLSNASKTATNFLTYDTSNGVQLGNRSGGSWASFRTQITSAAFNILDSAGNMLASYGAKLIELGKNATDAVIMLCGGKGKIEYSTVEVGSPELYGEPSGVNDEAVANAATEPEYDNYLRISADKLRLQGDNAVSLYSKKQNGDNSWEKTELEVFPEFAQIWSTTSGSIDNSHIEVSPSHVRIHSTGYISITSDIVKDVYGNPYLSVESGSSGNWHYKKWSNGDAELWMNYAIAGWDCSNEFGACYRTDLITIPSFPFKVYSPSLTVSYETDGYGAIPWATSPTTVDGPPTYYLVRPTSFLIENGTLVFHVLGKWKNIYESGS